MLSLEKIYDADSWNRFRERVREGSENSEPSLLLQPKYDGIAVSLRYIEGKLIQAATRGDGWHGQDITAHVLAIAPKVGQLHADSGTTTSPALLEVRGEIHAPLDRFQALNEERRASGLEGYLHPRNFAGGVLARDQADDEELACLELVIFGIGAWEPSRHRPTTESALLQKLKLLGLPVVPRVKELSLEESSWEAILHFAEDRNEWAYPVDGIVAKVNEYELQNTLGLGATAPRWAAAIKFAPPEALTTLRAVVPEVGRTGVLTPVAEFDPVLLSGAEISRASLHHYAHVEALGLHLGDTIHVERAGEIIPQVSRVEADRRASDAVPITPPTHCPSCHAETIREGVAIYCPNASCTGRLVRRLEHFASDNAMAIDGLGRETLEYLVRIGAIRSLEDIFALSEEQLAHHGVRDASRVHDAIEASKEQPLWRVLVALGIPQIGPARAKILATSLSSLRELLDPFALDQMELPTIVSEQLRSFLAESVNRQTIAALASAGLGKPRTLSGTQTPLTDRIFVFTGTLRDMSREEAVARVEALGGAARSRVSGTTDYLVVGINPGGKLEEARQRNVTILDEAAFLQLLAEAADGTTPEE